MPSADLTIPPHNPNSIVSHLTPTGFGFPDNLQPLHTTIYSGGLTAMTVTPCGCVKFYLDARRIAIVPCKKHTARYSRFYDRTARFEVNQK